MDECRRQLYPYSLPTTKGVSRRSGFDAVDDFARGVARLAYSCEPIPLGVPMKVLFVHQNFPGQYVHLARHLGAIPGNEVVFITQRTTAELPGVRKIVYKPARAVTKGVHHYIRDTEAGVLNAQNVARVALDLKAAGFVPDVMLAHNGWGELWYLKDVY